MTRHCLFCGEPLPVSSRRNKRYCDQRCYDRSPGRLGERVSDARRAARRPAPQLCAWCGVEFQGKQTNVSYCSKECRRAHRGRRECPISYGACAACGKTFIISRNPNRACCSTQCHVQINRRRCKDRLRRAPRRDLYTIRMVAERDGWRCHICGKRVPDRKFSHHPLDATVDHLIPISAGGNDTLDNVALAHSRCNIVRCTGGEVQLRLTA